MSLKKLLTTEGLSTIKYLYVNIISVLSYNYYIVGDQTAIGIMSVDETSKKKFKVGTGLKILKPKQIEKDTFLLDEPVMETKPMLLTKPDKLRLEELEKKKYQIFQKQRKVKVNTGISKLFAMKKIQLLIIFLSLCHLFQEI